MTDERPQPRYGQYAPTPTVLPMAPIAEPAVIPAPRRSADVFVTTALLLLGVVDVVTGFPQFRNLASTLRATYAAQGLPAFTADALANSMGVGINIARVTLLAATIAVSLVLIRRHRRAFWVPLVGAAVAALVVIVCVFVVIINDPAFAAYIATQGTAG